MIVGEKVDISIFNAPKVEHKEADAIATWQKYPLRDYQIKCFEGALQNFRDDGFSALLMDMGTGKTKVTIDLAMYMSLRKAATGLIVIAPKMLRSTWKNEVEKHAKAPFDIYVWDGKSTKKSCREFDAFMEGPNVIAPNGAPRTKLFICNVEAFQAMNPTFVARVTRFRDSMRTIAAVDESSKIKEHSTIRFQNLSAFAASCHYRLILTGTFLVNSPLDCFSQFEYLKKGFFGCRSFWQFRKHFAILEDRYGSGGVVHKEVVGYQKTDELMAMMKPYIQVARIEDCIKDMPEKNYQTIDLEMSPNQQRMYDEMYDMLMTQLETGEVASVTSKSSIYSKARQICGGTIIDENGIAHRIDKDGGPKLAGLIDIVEGFNEQMIVTAFFQEEIRMIEEALSKIGKTISLYGDTPDSVAASVEKEFDKKNIQYIVMNAQKGGYGMNLQCAHGMVDYTRHTSPDANNQAESRIWRSGQKLPCFFYKLMFYNTIEVGLEESYHAKKDMTSEFARMRPNEFAKLFKPKS